MADGDKPFNLTLADMRRRYGMTQAEAARAIGVDQSTVSRLESGAQMASVDQFITLAELYGGSVTINLGDGKNPAKAPPFVVWNVRL